MQFSFDDFLSYGPAINIAPLNYLPMGIRPPQERGKEAGREGETKPERFIWNGRACLIFFVLRTGTKKDFVVRRLRISASIRSRLTPRLVQKSAAQSLPIELNQSG
jgi:hypothetical protein